MHLQSWPTFDPDLVRQDTVTMVVQVNGKVRDRIEVDAGISEADASDAALTSPRVVEAMAGATPKRVVVKPPAFGQHRGLIAVGSVLYFGGALSVAFLTLDRVRRCGLGIEFVGGACSRRSGCCRRVAQHGPFVGVYSARRRRSVQHMDQGTLGLATKLLAKAQATSFDAEAAALTERAYRLLAHELNAYDDGVSADGKPRRRERRHLHDRRSNAEAPSPGASAPGAGATSTSPSRAHSPSLAGRRAEWFAAPGRSLVDLRV